LVLVLNSFLNSALDNLENADQAFASKLLLKELDFTLYPHQRLRLVEVKNRRNKASANVVRILAKPKYVLVGAGGRETSCVRDVFSLYWTPTIVPPNSFIHTSFGVRWEP
jgi:hypothetical protein